MSATSTSAIPTVGSEPGAGQVQPERASAPTPATARARRASRTSRPGRDAEHDAGERRGTTSAARIGERRLVARPRPPRVRGGPSSTSPTTLTKQNTASAAVAASAASASAPASPSPTSAVARDVQQRLQRQPLRGEAVQRRQAGDRHRADEERAARPRHPAQQPAEPVELERADRALERARAEEEQRLEDRVVERVQQRRRERERRPRVGAARAQHAGRRRARAR